MEISVLTTGAVPEWAPDFHAPLQPQDAPASPEIFLKDQGLAASAGAAASPAPAHPRVSITTHTEIAPDPEEAETTLPLACNDDEQAPKRAHSTRGRKRKSRRKPKRDDRRRSRRTMVISKKDYEAGMTAWGRARLKGLALDTLVTLRPAHFEHLEADERHAWCMGRIKSLGQWFADNDDRPEFAALWSREAKRIGDGRSATAEGEHIHILVHAGDHRDDLERMLRKKLKGRSEVDVRPATQDVMRLDCGWLGDAATYVLKAVSQQVWSTYRSTPHRPSGPIWGTRCGWTKNIAA